MEIVGDLVFSASLDKLVHFQHQFILGNHMCKMPFFGNTVLILSDLKKVNFFMTLGARLSHQDFGNLYTEQRERDSF